MTEPKVKIAMGTKQLKSKSKRKWKAAQRQMENRVEKMKLS